MSVAAEISACPLCGGSIGIGDKECPNCHATAQWRDYARAVEFARKAFADWLQRGLIREGNQKAMDQSLLAVRQNIANSVKEGRPFPPDTGLSSPTACWRCGRPVADYYSYCNTCGAPLGMGADTLRYLAYVSNEITGAAAMQLTLTQAHACTADVRGHLLALRAELERGRLNADQLAAERLSRLRDMKNHAAPVESGDEISTAPAVVESPIFAARPPPLPISVHPKATPRRSILEILLDPRSIQWLLASGGVLLVVGLVIWLASLGVFKNTLVVATCLGAGTLVLLAGGCATVRLTRYQLAGRALALLACLVMPLNLWFYHANGLVTLEGHLWLAALVCCALYAAAAAILEDPVFVYVLMAGVAMTGCLILADMHKLMQVAAPATLLVSLGLIALHAERAFAEGDGHSRGSGLAWRASGRRRFSWARDSSCCWERSWPGGFRWRRRGWISGR